MLDNYSHLIIGIKRQIYDGESLVDFFSFCIKKKKRLILKLPTVLYVAILYKLNSWLDEFKPEHKGQVELYLKWLDKYERAEGEESPVAIILCATKSDMMTELLELSNSGIHVAQYLTNYVPKELLEEKFLSSIRNAKIQLEQRCKNEEKE